MRHAIRLALRELRQEWLSAGCFVFALAGVLAPLLILLALKNGVIGTMVDRLVENPANREIIPIGVKTYDASFLAELAQREDVAFIVPATRRINAQATAVRNSANRNMERGVPLIPSGAGDPIVNGTPVTEGRVWITTATARAMDAGAGAELEILIGRDIDGTREIARQTMTVAGVVPESLNGRHGLYIALEDLLKAERFRDQASVSADRYNSRAEPPVKYAGFRMYATDLTALSGLLADLEALEIQARPRAGNVALLLGFRDNLNVLYVFIAVTAGFGFWAAMAANLRSMVERQRVVFSLLRLLGMRSSHCAQVPMIQSFCLVGLGVLLTLGFVWLGIGAINSVIQPAGSDPVAYLGFWDVACTALLGCLTALTAASWAIRAVYTVEMSEVLRNG
ncbi:FtsX-like permease family protein [Leisingera sp. S232]|uniref:FtsX-like permease family protein n=1 Tax=Leisingera sp. S232 TaxID=3415132 RepID=UPI003C7C34A5